VTVLGDELYCQEPYCLTLRSYGLGFVLVCKHSSHPVTYDWLEYLGRSGAVRTVVRTHRNGMRHETDTYRYAEALPLRDADVSLKVNWCELTTTAANGKVLYRNAFATELNDAVHQPS
jgi:hypothetical protein